MKFNSNPETILAESLEHTKWGAQDEAGSDFLPIVPSERAILPDERAILPDERAILSDERAILSDERAGREQRRLTLAELLKKSPGIPAHNALLGVCEDALPVLFDLHDTTLGSLLTVASQPETAFELLGTLAFSTAALNPARQAQIMVISSRAEEWQTHPALAWAGRSFLGIYSCFERAAEDAILRTAEWARQGQLGQRRGPKVLLVIDDLAACAEMDFDARLNLEWLLREGSAVGIRPAAAVTGEALLDITSWVSSFTTCLLGEIEDRRIYHTLNLLEPGHEFPMLGADGLAARVNSGWFVFRTVRL